MTPSVNAEFSLPKATLGTTNLEECRSAILRLVQAYGSALTECDKLPIFSAWGYVSLFLRVIGWMYSLFIIPIIIIANIPAYVANTFYHRHWKYHLTRVLTFFRSFFLDFYRVDLSGLRVMHISYLSRLLMAIQISFEVNRIRGRLKFVQVTGTLLQPKSDETNAQNKELHELSQLYQDLKTISALAWPRSGISALLTFPPLAAFLSVAAEWILDQIKSQFENISATILGSSKTVQISVAAISSPSHVAVTSLEQSVALTTGVVMLAIFSCLVDKRNIVSMTGVAEAEARVNSILGLPPQRNTQFDILCWAAALGLLMIGSKREIQLEPSTLQLWSDFFSFAKPNTVTLIIVQQFIGVVGIAIFLIYLRHFAGWAKRTFALSAFSEFAVHPKLIERFRNFRLSEMISIDGLVFYGIFSCILVIWLLAGAAVNALQQ